MSDGIERVRGKGITVVFEGRKCIHSRNCVLARPDVFVPNVQGEWIHPEVATPEEIVALAENCPSGAIRYEYDDGRAEPPAKVNVARVREDGPVAITGELVIAGVEARRATLCRCGASKHKPYCDGSHTAAEFKASGERAPKKVDPLPVRDGRLEITRVKDGPLKVVGNLEVCTGTGHPVARGTQTWLCRCGQSKDKPFCDGSHTKAGFVADGD
jgi:CDGSH-type Zn-finger protein/uncharacterized Fe-S cluster protein YjdI